MTFEAPQAKDTKKSPSHPLLQMMAPTLNLGWYRWSRAIFGMFLFFIHNKKCEIVNMRF